MQKRFKSAALRFSIDAQLTHHTAAVVWAGKAAAALRQGTKLHVRDAFQCTNTFIHTIPQHTDNILTFVLLLLLLNCTAGSSIGSIGCGGGSIVKTNRPAAITADPAGRDV